MIAPDDSRWHSVKPLQLSGFHQLTAEELRFLPTSIERLDLLHTKITDADIHILPTTLEKLTLANTPVVKLQPAWGDC